MADTQAMLQLSGCEPNLKKQKLAGNDRGLLLRNEISRAESEVLNDVLRFSRATDPMVEGRDRSSEEEKTGTIPTGALVHLFYLPHHRRSITWNF